MSICIYHAGCDDGFGAAYAVWKKFGDAFEYVAAQYGQEPPDVTNKRVIIVDFSYKLPVLESIIKKCHSLLILDHHKTAAADLSALPPTWDNWEDHEYAPSHRAHAVFDMNRSGAGIAWDFFHKGLSRPALINYIEDRDLWTKKLPGIDEFTAGIRSYPQDFALWDSFDVDKLIDEGRAILRYQRIQIEKAKQRAVKVSIGGYEVPAVNCPESMASEVAGELAEGHPFAACFWIGPGGTTYSLRSRGDGVDVSEVAKQYGGGGHKNAAGYKVAN